MTDTLPPGITSFNSASLPTAALASRISRSAPRHQIRIVPPPQHLAMDRLSPRGSVSPLPRDLSPRESRARHLNATPDIRSESLTQAEAREMLSDWVVYRLEKAKNLDGVDSNGYPVQPSWDHVRRCRIGGVSKREISKEVRDLDKKTSPVAVKKDNLSETIQYQIDMAQDHLTQNERDPRYQYTLAQIDCELKQRDSSVDSEDRSSRERDRHRSSSSRRKSRSRKSKSKTRKTFERVSVTAYFKRAPRREEDAVAMHQRQERDAMMRQSPVEHQDIQSRRASIADPATLQRSTQHLLSPQHQSHPAFADQHRQRRHSQILSIPHQSSSPSTNSAHVDSQDGKEIQAARDSPKASQSSFTDDDYAVSENELTPLSSIDGSPLRRTTSRQTRFRSRSRSRDRPRPPPRSRSSSPVPESPRRHGRDDDNYVWTSAPSKAHAPSPSDAKLRTLPIDIRRPDDLDRLYKPSRVDLQRVAEPWDDEAARQQDRARRRRSVADIEVLEHSSKSRHHHIPPPLSQPSRVNRRRASVRIIAPGDLDQEKADRDVDRHFERLHIDEERRPRRTDKVRFQDEKGDSRDHDRRSRRSVDYTTRHPDEIFHMEDDMSWDQRLPREYRRRSSSSEVDRNPFTGRPITRRISEYR